MTGPDEQTTTRRSVSYSTGYEPPDPTLCHMFVQDVAEGLVPYSLTEAEEERVVTLSTGKGRQELVRQAILSGGSKSHGYGRQSLFDAVVDFIRTTAYRILTHCHTDFELVFYPNDRAANDRVELVSIPTGSVRLTSTRAEQVIPQAIADTHHIGPVIILDRTLVFRFTLPPPFRRILPGILQGLAAISDIRLPEFVLATTGTASRVPFDYELHRWTSDVAVARLTRLTGWTGRGSSFERMLEHYQLVRLLRFERFKIRVRDEIVATLNNALVTAGQRIADLGHIVVRELPTEADVDAAEARLASGDGSFGDVSRAFFRA
jgi:hypothetical protein